MSDDVQIVRLVDVAERAGGEAAIEAIFWETVAVMPPLADQAAFRDLWFGQYLRLEPELVFVAIDSGGHVGGYLVGSVVNPATSPRFAVLTFFRAFAEACGRYPAHLHINLTAAWRGRGVGGRLIDAFADAVRKRGVVGIHAVTGADSRNVTFYARAGFREIARTTNARGRGVVFLGRDIA